jgi:hypothetical protein
MPEGSATRPATIAVDEDVAELEIAQRFPDAAVSL